MTTNASAAGATLDSLLTTESYTCRASTDGRMHLCLGDRERIQKHNNEAHPPDYFFGCKCGAMNLHNLNRFPTLSYTSPQQLKYLGLAPEMFRPYGKKRQVSVVLQRLQYPYWCLSPAEIRPLYIWCQSSKDRSIVDKSSQIMFLPTSEMVDTTTFLALQF